jgi:hypothetical protein
LHSFGLAADLVQIKEKAPYFGPEMSGYERMHVIAKDLGLKTMEARFSDPPHVELADMSIADLQRGTYPPGGDAAWTNNLTWNIQNWTRVVSAIQAWGPELPKAPVPPAIGGN